MVRAFATERFPAMCWAVTNTRQQIPFTRSGRAVVVRGYLSIDDAVRHLDPFQRTSHV